MVYYQSEHVWIHLEYAQRRQNTCMVLFQHFLLFQSGEWPRPRWIGDILRGLREMTLIHGVNLDLERHLLNLGLGFNIQIPQIGQPPNS